ncbi:TPA: hypothetical protein R8G75_002047 [Citrobacter pasteurii]|nr:hypothetical protein [Citrobacter pasteurii]
MLSSITGLNFTLTSHLPSDTFAVVSFELMEAFSAPFALQVRLVSSNPAVDFTAVMDAQAMLMVTETGVVQRTVNGIVTAFEQGETLMRIQCYSFLMITKPKVSGFQCRW